MANCVAPAPRKSKRRTVRIKIKYESSQGPHVIDLTRSEIDRADVDGDVTVVQETPGKTMTISGNPTERVALARALLKGTSSDSPFGPAADQSPFADEAGC